MLTITEDWIYDTPDAFAKAVVVYIDDIVYFLVPMRDARTVGKFGGPINAEIHGLAEGARIHKFIEFDGLSDKVNMLPLLYGICHDGCTMSYHQEDQAIVIDNIRPPAAHRDWPYSDYPPHYPTHRLGVLGQGRCEFDLFKHFLMQQEVAQGDERWSHVIVPPSEGWRVSLWGKWGDAEEVQTVFSIDPIQRRVFVENQCT
ncbi:hypothetical protein OT109_16645 [Phycisphaeraceae bacterium D3-23]